MVASAVAGLSVAQVAGWQRLEFLELDLCVRFDHLPLETAELPRLKTLSLLGSPVCSSMAERLAAHPAVVCPASPPECPGFPQWQLQRYQHVLSQPVDHRCGQPGCSLVRDGLETFDVSRDGFLDVNEYQTELQVLLKNSGMQLPTFEDSGFNCFLETLGFDQRGIPPEPRIRFVVRSTCRECPWHPAFHTNVTASAPQHDLDLGGVCSGNDAALAQRLAVAVCNHSSTACVGPCGIVTRIMQEVDLNRDGLVDKSEMPIVWEEIGLQDSVNADILDCIADLADCEWPKSPLLEVEQMALLGFEIFNVAHSTCASCSF